MGNVFFRLPKQYGDGLFDSFAEYPSVRERIAQCVAEERRDGYPIDETLVVAYCVNDAFRVETACGSPIRFAFVFADRRVIFESVVDGEITPWFGYLDYIASGINVYKISKHPLPNYTDTLDSI